MPVVKQYRDLRPWDVVDVEVQPDPELDDWWPGDLEGWRQEDDGTWTGDVRYSRGPGQPNYLGWFPENQIRRPVG